MPVLLRYLVSDDPTQDGRIEGAWDGTSVEILQAQIPTEDVAHGYLLVEAPEASALEYLQRYAVIGGVPVLAEVLTLAAQPNPFAADGVTVSTVTLTPFVPCDLLVDGTPYRLVEDDPVLELTSDTPQLFVITMAPQAAYRAEPLRVEATNA